MFSQECFLGQAGYQSRDVYNRAADRAISAQNLKAHRHQRNYEINFGNAPKYLGVRTSVVDWIRRMQLKRYRDFPGGPAACNRGNGGNSPSSCTSAAAEYQWQESQPRSTRHRRAHQKYFDTSGSARPGFHSRKCVPVCGQYTRSGLTISILCSSSPLPGSFRAQAQGGGSSSIQTIRLKGRGNPVNDWPNSDHQQARAPAPARFKWLEANLLAESCPRQVETVGPAPLIDRLPGDAVVAP